MEVKLENLYVDVRAKKNIKTIGNSLETCAPVEKNHYLVGKSTIGL